LIATVTAARPLWTTCQMRPPATPPSERRIRKKRQTRIRNAWYDGFALFPFPTHRIYQAELLSSSFERQPLEITASYQLLLRLVPKPVHLSLWFASSLPKLKGKEAYVVLLHASHATLRTRYTLMTIAPRSERPSLCSTLFRLLPTFLTVVFTAAADRSSWLRSRPRAFDLMRFCAVLFETAR
jgi:hypothetical protein